MVEWTSPDPIDQMTPSLIQLLASAHSQARSFHDEPSLVESANGCPQNLEAKATRVTWEPHVSIFRLSNSTLYRSIPAVRRTALWVITDMEISWLKNLRLLLFQPEKHTS